MVVIGKYKILRVNKLSRFLHNLSSSIRSKILISFIFIILIVSIMNVRLLLSFLKYSREYNTIVTNITVANSINGIFKPSIDSEMWDIVAGKIKFENGKQYQIIRSFNSSVEQIMQNVSTPENRIRLDVALRAVKTLTRYVDMIGDQIKQKKPVAENENVLVDVRGVSELVEEDIQEFIFYEVKSCEKVNLELQSSINHWILTNTIVLGIVLLFSVLAAWFISGSISRPIRELRRMTASISEGNFDVRVENKNVDEIAALGRSFNIMTEKIKELLENSRREQENFKKSELRVLQAQINPHFLYNTLDTIIWMSEANRSGKVIELVKALSNFFRITLSKGKDWISVRDEVEHIRNYLIIQKIRYADIMNFNIEIDSDIMNYSILKLTLQPLVENALYHGIKNKRNGGCIIIRGSKINNENILFEVIDNGAGMTKEKLTEILFELNNEGNDTAAKESGFGLYNVHKRIRLYYGKQYGLTLQSEQNKGTHIFMKIPMER